MDDAGRFPVYTKRKLEEIYSRWNNKRQAERQAKPAQPKPVEQAVKNEVQKPAQQKPYNKPYQNKPAIKKEEPAAPVNDDMLKQLADKFKKG